MFSFGSRPGGLSTLMTSAPKSAKMRVQVGPARTRVRSSTRTWARAVDGLGRGMRTLAALQSDAAGESLLRRDWFPAHCGRLIAEAPFRMHGEGQGGSEHQERDRADERQRPVAGHINDEAEHERRHDGGDSRTEVH